MKRGGSAMKAADVLDVVQIVGCSIATLNGIAWALYALAIGDPGPLVTHEQVAAAYNTASVWGGVTMLLALGALFLWGLSRVCRRFAK